MSNNIQLTSATSYDVNNIVCSEPKLGEVKQNDQDKSKKDIGVTFQRITVSTKYPDGTVGDLILPTEELFSFGVGENTSKETGHVTGHTMSLCLWNRDRQSEQYVPTESQLAWTNTYTRIVDFLKKVMIDFHKKGLLETRSFNKYRYAKDDEDAEENGGFTSVEFKGQLRKFNNLYWGKGKKSAKSIDEGSYENGPTLYAKLIESKKKGALKIMTQFYDYENNPIDPLKQLTGVYCTTFSAVKIESIFVGNNISLQVKLYESNCKILDGGMTRLLPRPNVNNRLLLGKANDMSNPVSDKVEEENGSINDESDNDNDNDIDVQPQRKPAKVQPRRKVRAVAVNK